MTYEDPTTDAAKLAEHRRLHATLPEGYVPPPSAAQTQLEELRKAVAEILGEDPVTWPSHGNAPLAIASIVALLKLRSHEAVPGEANMQRTITRLQQQVTSLRASRDYHRDAAAEAVKLLGVFKANRPLATPEQIEEARTCVDIFENIEIDDDAAISVANDGVWVQAWVRLESES